MKVGVFWLCGSLKFCGFLEKAVFFRRGFLSAAQVTKKGKQQQCSVRLARQPNRAKVEMAVSPSPPPRAVVNVRCKLPHLCWVGKAAEQC